MDRLANHVDQLKQTGRGIEAQQKSLQIVHQLLNAGWGLFLGKSEEQQQDLAGTLSCEPVKAAFMERAGGVLPAKK